MGNGEVGAERGRPARRNSTPACRAPTRIVASASLGPGRTGWPRSSPVHCTIAYFRNDGGVGVNILNVSPSGVTTTALTFL